MGGAAAAEQCRRDVGQSSPALRPTSTPPPAGVPIGAQTPSFSNVSLKCVFKLGDQGSCPCQGTENARETKPNKMQGMLVLLLSFYTA